MDIQELVNKNKYEFSYGSFEYNILEAWGKGDETQKTLLQNQFPKLFKDGEVKWRTPEEMKYAVSGYYWEESKKDIVKFDGSHLYWCGSDDYDKVDNFTTKFYGPILPNRIPVLPSLFVLETENETPEIS